MQAIDKDANYASLYDDRATATVNARLPKELKLCGEQVLAREGVSVSEMIRRLYAHLDKIQTIPDFLKSDSESDPQERIAKKRSSLRSLVGVGVEDGSLEHIKDRRLERQLRSGLL
jgi:antitoxin component of RelBE/YafQ-DinJ toxin-antitoxin module